METITIIVLVLFTCWLLTTICTAVAANWLGLPKQSLEKSLQNFFTRFENYGLFGHFKANPLYKNFDSSLIEKSIIN